MATQIFGSLVLGLVVVAICVAIIVYLLHWLYRRATKDTAFVRTGFLGEKVVINGGAFVIPVLHEVTPVDMRVSRIEVERRNKDALITSDRIRVDVVADFFIRVGSTSEMAAAAAQAFGRRTEEVANLRELVEGRFVSALRAAAARMTLFEMHERRDEYSRMVREFATEALHAQGLDAAGDPFICPENLGSMSGIMKDMFDRAYYPLLGQVEGRPYATAIAAGSDGRGAEAQISRIVTGWRLRRVAEPLDIVGLDAQSPAVIRRPRRCRKARSRGAANWARR